MAESVLVGANRSSAVEHTSKDTWLRRQLLALTQGLESVAAVAEMRSAFVLSPLDNAYAPSAFHTFNADGRLFDDHNGERYRETLQLLLSESQMRIWLRQDLKLLCEVQRYRNLHEGRELGLKIALSYRFR